MGAAVTTTDFKSSTESAACLATTQGEEFGDPYRNCFITVATATVRTEF